MALADRFFRIDKDKARPFTKNDRNIMLRYLRKCDFPDNIYLTEVKLYWYQELKKRGLRGAFVTYYPDCVFLPPVAVPVIGERSTPQLRKFAEDNYDSNIKDAAPIAIHEIEHISQYKEYGPFKYGLYSLPGLYNTMLDGPAYARESAAAVTLTLNPQLYGRPL